MTSVVLRAQPRLLVVSTLALWGAQLAVVAGGVVRGKAGAVWLGPHGMGLVAQLNYLSTFVAGLAVLGLSNGCIRVLSQARGTGDIELERRARTIAILLPLALGIVAAASVAVFFQPVGRLLFGGDAHALSVLAAALSVPLGLVGSALAVVLQGRGQMRRLARTNLLVAAANTAVVVALVAEFGLAGGIAGVALTSAVTSAIFVARERDLLRSLALRTALRDRPLLRTLYAFGLASVTLSLAASLAELATRTVVVHRLGVDENGVYQAVAMLSSQFFLGAIAALATYLFPQLSALAAAGAIERVRADVDAGLRLLLGIVVPAATLAVVLAPWLIPIAFSAEFAPAEPVLEWQLPGEIWRALAWTVGALLLPLGLVRAWLLIGLATVGVQVGLAVVLVEPLGLRGVGVAYLASWVFNAVVAFLVVRSAIGYRPLGAARRAVAGAAVISFAVVAAAQLGDAQAVLVGVLMLLGWWLATGKDTLRLVLARTGAS